jgi:signal peptidase I
MGDNRDESHDSRFWGPVPADLVRGRALLIYWSYETRPAVLAERGRGVEVRRFLDTAVHFFSRTRWRRTFRLVR